MINVSLHSESFSARARNCGDFSSVTITTADGEAKLFINGEKHTERAAAIADAINANGSVPVAASAEAA